MTTPTLDPRVFAHLQRQGVITADRVTKKPTTRACRTCHAPVIAAIEDETAGRMRVEVHPAFLTPYGELQAVLTGVATFEVTDDALWWRDPSRIAGHPADTVPVMAEHACHSPPFDHGPNPVTAKRRTTQRPINPPF